MMYEYQKFYHNIRAPKTKKYIPLPSSFNQLQQKTEKLKSDTHILNFDASKKLRFQVDRMRKFSRHAYPQKSGKGKIERKCNLATEVVHKTRSDFKT